MRDVTRSRYISLTYRTCDTCVTMIIRRNVNQPRDRVVARGKSLQLTRDLIINYFIDAKYDETPSEIILRMLPSSKQLVYTGTYMT